MAPASSCRAKSELEEAFVSLMGDPVRRARLGAAARALVEANRGAKEKSITVLSAIAAAAVARVSRQRQAVSDPLLDSLYAQVMRVRRRRYEREPARQRRLSKPVISVGNLSVGGTGKTPVVAALAQWLVDRGERPSILSRGYARAKSVDGVVVVSDGREIRASVDRAGDEPMMLARQVPGAIVCVSPERYLSGVLAERELGATVHILDDGFQHLELARDLDVLVTTVGEIPGGKVMPRGRLREPIEAAARAQVLVVSDATAGAAAAEAWALGISQACGAARTLGEPVVIRDQASGRQASGLRHQGSERVHCRGGHREPRAVRRRRSSWMGGMSSRR